MGRRSNATYRLCFLLWIVIFISVATLAAQVWALGVATLFGDSNINATLLAACLSLPCILIVAIAAGVAIHHTNQINADSSQRDTKLAESHHREQAQLELLHSVINNIKYLIIYTDPQGYIRLCNSAALDLLDTNRSPVDHQINDVFSLVDDSSNKINFSQLITNSARPIDRNDLRFAYKDGQKINLSIAILPVHTTYHGGNALAGFIIMARDITKEKTLDDERDEFISVVSHELRTPVAIAEGALSNLQFIMAHHGDVTTLSTTLDAAHDQILYLGQMVNDLSTLSRAERGIYMDNELINITTFMNSLYGKYSKEARENKLKLTLDSKVLGTIRTSRMAIEEIMQNIIINAIKYTDRGDVVIGARTCRQRGYVEFFVRDTGIGISKSDLGHIFERFWRSEDYRTRQHSGTGLGLYVVARLAAKINTHVKATSELGRGSEFTFRLPFNK